MATSNYMYQNRRNTRKVTRRNQAHWMEVQELHHEIRKLNDLLGKERSNYLMEQTWRLQLSQELDETKQQLAKQKTLKEMYINRGKETKRDLERLEKYTDPETLCTTKIATQIRNTIKRKKKKLLQKDYEELQVAHIISEEKLSEEREKNKALQEELERLRASYQQDTQRYEADVQAVRQQADSLQRELEKEQKAHADTMTEDLLLEQELRVEQDALRQKLEEISLTQQNAVEQEMILRREVEELKTQLNVQFSLNVQLSTELKAERENKHPLQENITSPESEENQEEEPEEEPEEGPEEGPEEQQENVPYMQEESYPDPESMETDGVIHPLKRRKASVWKKTRHFLGLRKPQRWKKPKEPTINGAI